MDQAQPSSSDESRYRYERKFLVSGFDTRQLVTMIRLHPLVFSTAFPDRSVNNIYFDTEDFQYFRDNVEGVSNRKKIRIRWYGPLDGALISPVLEYKIKRGPVGYKVSYPLAQVKLDFGIIKIRNILDQMLDCDLPESVKHDLRCHKAVMLNSYRRKYFLSRDRRFRVTVDNNLAYYRITSSNSNTLHKDADYRNSVIELKYSMEDDNEAKSVSNAFPFRMTKNSKYVSGVDRLYGGVTY